MAPRLRVAVLTILVLMAALVIIPRPSEGLGQLEPFMTGLDWPVAMAFASDGRIFYAELFTGQIRIIEDGALLPDPLIVLPKTVSDGETGLLGLALDPGFPTNPWVYVYQTYDDTANATRYNRIIRLLANGNTASFDRELVTRIPAANIHNGGVLTFGPDGNLYAIVGDAVNQQAAQDLASFGGKVLRFGPDGSVPSDNPFVATPGANAYVYTYGHRNGFGLAFHPATGGLYETENGPACVDEVNLLQAGENYGWGPSHDPFTCETPPPMPYNTNQDGPSPVLPLHWWESTIAPTNAVVYAGPDFPELQGDLIVGDFNTGSLRRLDLAPPAYDAVLSESVLLTVSEGILDVDVGPGGAIWFTTPSVIYRYVDQNPPPGATFDVTPFLPRINETATFDASASVDPDGGTILDYAWDFGDGANGTGVVATHAYVAAGTFTVTLVVRDDEFLINQTTRDVTVVSEPRAAFSYAPSSAVPGQPVAFNGSGSTDVGGTIVSYAWDFGDGTQGSGIVVSHAYEAPGVYEVRLMVTDNASRSNTTTQSVRIESPPGLGADPWLLGILAVVGAVAVAGIVLALRSRRARRQGKGPQP